MKCFYSVGGALVIFQRIVTAQQWLQPVNISMCNWSQLRADKTRDIVYANGGDPWWTIGRSDGTYGTPQSDGNAEGTFFSFSLARAFDLATTNVTGLFYRDLQPEGAAVNFESGTIFATDSGFVLFGGVTRPTERDDLPGPRDLLGYERYESGPHQASWEPGFRRTQLPTNMTRYITHGAGVSVPSERLGFYFGGMRGPDWGPIYARDGSANTSAATLITADLSTMDEIKWANDSLPKDVATRANAQLAWIPVGVSGALAVVGGVTHPEDVYPAGLSEAQISDNERTGTSFLRTVPIYDIAHKRWYLQNTTGDLPPRASALSCIVVASAPDGSSHNIYLYGGYDGTDPEQTAADDVYILTLPSFSWVRAYTGHTRHGRRGHQCVRVFPDQMLVLGGLLQDPSVCVDGGVVQIFNLNTLAFQDTYAPDVWAEYRVPQVVVDRVGGSDRGGATRTRPNAWTDPGLAAVFNQTYPRPIQTWYPYQTSPTADSPTTTRTAEDSSSPPRLLPVLLGTLLPVCLGVLVGVILCFVRRRGRAAPLMQDCGRHGHLTRVLAALGLHSCKSCPVEMAGSPVGAPPPIELGSEKQTGPSALWPEYLGPPVPPGNYLRQLPVIEEHSDGDPSEFSFVPTPVDKVGPGRPHDGTPSPQENTYAHL